MLKHTDKQLIHNYFAGNEKSLEILIKHYLKFIHNFAYRYTGNSQDAEDIAQEVFIKVWKNLKKFDKNKKFKTWIFSIAKNACIDCLKKKKAMPFSKFANEQGENLFAETLMDPAPLPNEIFEQASIAEMLNTAMHQLAPKYRMVLFLRYNDHFKFREIAETLSEPLNTIKSRHRRALIFTKKITC